MWSKCSNVVRPAVEVSMRSNLLIELQVKPDFWGTLALIADAIRCCREEDDASCSVSVSVPWVVNLGITKAKSPRGCNMMLQGRGCILFRVCVRPVGYEFGQGRRREGPLIEIGFLDLIVPPPVAMTMGHARADRKPSVCGYTTLTQ